MKKLYVIFLIFLLLLCSGFSVPDNNIYVSYQPNVDRLEVMFKTYLPLKDGVVFTKVPRGLIVSIDERCFFNDGEARIKESSLCLLNTIAVLLQQLPNYCVIEDHTEESIFKDSDYNENWEISLARAGNIVQYLIVYGKLNPDQLFALGYGQYMPFRDNVSPKIGMNNRIDFVILEYETKR